MSHYYLVRVGAMGAVGRLRSADGSVFARDMRVVCRTRRGLETGQVLAESRPSGGDDGSSDGELLRPMSIEDELLANRLTRFQHEAYEACQDVLERNGATTALMDVELLFDGRSLYFYFLGDAGDATESLLDELAGAYDMTAKIQRFQEALTNGCGPDCGTQEGGGCGTSGCSSCAISSACKAR